MEIPLPLRGLNDSLGFSRQQPTTSSDLLNWRSLDKLTGRVRLTQRSGLSKFTRAADSTNPVLYQNQIAFDGRKMLYSGISTGTSDWEFVTPSASESQRGVQDRQGNVIALDGRASVVKLNDAGQKVWLLAAPIKHPRHVVRALAVDRLDNVFLGVSEGGEQNLSRVWRFARDPKQAKDAAPKQVWELDVDGFAERVIINGDLLYVAVNQPDRWGARLACYRGALSEKPTLAWSVPAAYPWTGLERRTSDGAIFGCSSSFTSRGLDPRYPGYTEKTEDASLRDILGDLYDTVVWRDMDASTLESLLTTTGHAIQDGDSSIRDGDSVLLWPDVSGNDRDLFVRADFASSAPLYNQKGIGGEPSVYFRGNQTLPAIADALQCNFSASVTQSYLDQHQGLVPGYEGAMWVMFIVMRPEEDKGAAPLVRPVWGQPTAYGGSVLVTQGVYANRNSAGAAQAGYGTMADTTSVNGVGTGTTAFPDQFRYDEVAQPTTSAGVLTVMSDGGVNFGIADSGATGRSLLRWNGKPIDRWESLSTNKTIFPGYLGASQLAGSLNLRGDIARVIVLHSHGTPPQSGPITHPHYPHDIHTAAVAPVGSLYSAATPFNATQMEKIEGMLAHKYRLSHLLPPTGAVQALYGGAAPFATTNNHGNYPHPFYRQNGPPRSSTLNVRSEPYQLHSPNGLVAKWDGSKGDLQWVVSASSSDGGGGLGYGIAIDKDGNVFSVGPKITSPVVHAAFPPATAAGTFVTNYFVDPTNIRKIQDLNTKGQFGYSTNSAIGSVAWNVTLGTPGDEGTATPADDWTVGVTHLGLGTDEYGNLYVPINYPTIGPVTMQVYAANPETGTGLNVGNQIASFTATNNAQAYACLPVKSPTYRYGTTLDFDRAPTTDDRTNRAELCYVFAAQPTAAPSTDPGIYKARLVTATHVAGSPRTTVLVQVTNGDVTKFDATGPIAFAGASSLAAPQLSTAASYVDGAIVNNELFITDGLSYVRVDPINDIVRQWKASDGGSIPPRCKLICNWRGRIVLARDPEAPQNWNMSEMGEPTGWDQFGFPVLSTRAISGNNARARQCPDIVNALVPYSDQILIFGGDHSIYALLGDPADEGASAGMRLVSDVTGIAFGRAWCKSPEGVLFFFGSRGGVYRMVPGSSAPENMTIDTIDQRLVNIDLGTNRIELVWNTEDDGMHVFVIPAAEDAELVHYFWNRATDAWFSDTFAYPPSSVFVADGDLSDDRRLLLGGFDGFVREWDFESKNDDGLPIELRATIGPLAPEEEEMEWIFRDFEAVLARDQDGVWVSLFGSSTPDKKGDPLKTFQLTGGRNRIVPVSMSAPYCWVQLTQKNADRTVAIESLKWRDVRQGGRKRVNT